MTDDDHAWEPAVCPACGPVEATVTTVSLVDGADKVVATRSTAACPTCDRRLGDL
jgi:hypothetical protein